MVSEPKIGRPDSRLTISYQPVKRGSIFPLSRRAAPQSPRLRISVNVDLPCYPTVHDKGPRRTRGLEAVVT
jgi:hypothetical protein